MYTDTGRSVSVLSIFVTKVYTDYPIPCLAPFLFMRFTLTFMKKYYFSNYCGRGFATVFLFSKNFIVKNLQIIVTHAVKNTGDTLCDGGLP